MTYKQRRRRQALWGLASILCSITATVMFFGGAIVHDFGGLPFEKARLVISLMWLGSASMVIASIVCLIWGFETE